MAAYICVRVDWTNANKVNGSYLVFVDTVSPISSCASSGGAGYILAVDQSSYQSITQAYTGSSSVADAYLGTLDYVFIGEGFGYTLSLFFLGLTFGLIARLVSRMRSPR
jgi:hypothetical protein